jgi:hypothetical protein
MALTKCILIYILSIVVGYVLFVMVWGFVNGVLVAPRIGSDYDFKKELGKILTKEELERLNIPHVRELLGRVHELPPEKKDAIVELTRKHLEGVNWFAVHLFANAVTFGVLGFMLGVFRVHKYAILIPMFLLPVSLPVLRAEQFVVHTQSITMTIGLLTQVLAVYGFAAAGAWVHKKMTRDRIGPSPGS